MTKIMLPPIPADSMAGHASSNLRADPDGRWETLLNTAPNDGKEPQHTADPDSRLTGALQINPQVDLATDMPSQSDQQVARAVLIPALALPTGRISLVPIQSSYIGTVSAATPSTGTAETLRPAGTLPYFHYTRSDSTQSANEMRLSAVVADALGRSASTIKQATTTTERSSTIAASQTDWLARRLQLVVHGGLVDIRLRDYRLSNDELTHLVKALLSHAESEGMTLRKITVNGDAVWTKEAGANPESDSGKWRNNNG